MKSLPQYIVENVQSIFESAKFDRVANNVEDLFNLNINFVNQFSSNNTIYKFNEQDIKIIKRFISSLIDNKEYNYIENKLIYSEGNVSYIKMPYAYKPLINDIISNDEFKDFKVSNTDSLKISVTYKNKKIIETGLGSIKTVNTRDQEVATCLIWNRFVESLTENFTENDVNNEISNISKESVNDIMKDIMESSVGFNEEWAKSFTEQVITIKNFLTNIINDTNAFLYYRCERYGGDKKFDESNPDNKWEISVLYENFVSNYIHEIGGKKDNYDPSDIIIYDTRKIDSITTELENIIHKSYTDASGAKKDFVNIFYNSNNPDNSKNDLLYSLMGLSLKKISGKGTYQINNVPNENQSSANRANLIIINNDNIINDKEINLQTKISDINIEKWCDQIKRNGKIVVGGNFYFSKDDTEEQTNYCALVFRRFGYQKNGSQNIGIDITITNSNGKNMGPTLGKIPVRDWEKIIFNNNRRPDDITVCREEFANYIRNTFKNEDNPISKLFDDLTFLVQEGIKVGPNCLPHIIIH